MTPPDPRRPTRCLAAAAIVLVAAAYHAVTLSPVVAADDEAPAVRRVLLRPEQLPAELDRVRQGVLRQLPRAEFDDLLARATAAGAALRNPPRLVECRYRAALDGESLIGSAAWKVLHHDTTPGLLSAEP
ncbi:MAG TPA: hypothetical protein VGF55_29770, partial [Gemmataceae bacterium]